MVDKKLLDSYWEKGSYYSTTPEQIFQKPRFPNESDSMWCKFMSMFNKYVKLGPEAGVLEIGCGASAMLPFFNIRKNCRVFGIDNQPYAAKLAEVNLRANNAKGEIFCRDALDMSVNRELLGKMDLVLSFGVLEHFDDLTGVLKKISKYLRVGGYIITSVPNFNGFNGMLQKFVDKKILAMHAIHTRQTLQDAHQGAGFLTQHCQYWEVFNGYLTEAVLAEDGWRKNVHVKVCRYSNMLAQGLLRLSRFSVLPESKIFSPQILYIGSLSSNGREKNEK